MNLQHLIDGIMAEEALKRSESQMTLGDMIEALKELPGDMLIEGLGDLDSYRGYYSDLAFEPYDSSKTVFELLTQCKDAMGKVFHGYKGGDFYMTGNTPLWVAAYGVCGSKIMSITTEGVINMEDDDDV
jgi:hypothetical protein